MISIRCRCGEVLHADVQHVGRKVRCRCGRTHTVRVPRIPAGRATSPWADTVRRAFGRRRSRTSAPRFRTVRRILSWPSRPAAEPRSGPRGLARRFPAAVRWTRYAALAWLGLVIVAVILVWGLGDRTWHGTVFLFSGRWLVLVPLAPLALAAALLHRASLPVIAFAAVLVLFPVMGLRPGTVALRDAGFERIRVATFNAAGNPGAVQALMMMMEAHDVHVALLQECPPRPDALTVPGWQVQGTTGLCTISRHVIRRVASLDLEEVVPQNRTFGGTSAADRYELELPDRTVTLFNVHLETARRGLRGMFDADVGAVRNNLALRRVESRETAAWIGADIDEVIVAGDFNMPVESAIYRASWGRFTNAFSRTGRGFGFTRDNGWIRVRIDHVLSGRAWRPTRSWVGPDIGSDHRPVFAEFVRAVP